MTEQKKDPRKIKVKLIDAHTHDGVEYAEGDEIHVLPRQRDWLVSQGKVAGAAPAKQTGGK